MSKFRAVGRCGGMIFLVAALLSACGGSLDSSSVKVGDTAPSVRTKTLQDVGGDFSRITTYRYPDERMYQISLDQALAQKKKILLEFATPGHCTVCDKQLQMLKALINKYGSDVVFLHMDQYENPEAFSAFRVKGDPWTFLIDENGKVLYRQPGRVLYGELDSWLAKLVGDGVS